MPAYRLAARCLTAAVLALAASGCTPPGTAQSSAPVPEPTVGTSSVEPTASASPSPGGTASATPGGSSAPEPSPTPEPTDRNSSPGPVLVSPGTVEQLHLVDAFANDGFVEGVYQPVGRPSAARAMAAQLDKSTATLEFRFSQTSGRITVEAAQDILSSSSNQTVDVALLADGRRVAAKSIRFKESTTLSANLGGVAALQVQATAKGGATTVLVTKIVVQG